MNLSNLKVSKVSYETIRKAASTMSVGTSTMPNATSTAEKAPYLPRIISDGDWSLDDQAAAAAKLLGCTFEQARFYWSALMETVADVLTDGEHTSVEFGYWLFKLEVSGSVPSANSACEYGNVVWIAVYPSAELQAVAATIETKADISAQQFVIDCVFGENGERYLTGGKDALIMGRHFSAPTKIELVRGETVAECAYKAVEGDLPTRIRATLPTVSAAAKDYRLRITAAGDRGGNPVTIVKENVQVKAGALPPPEPIAQTPDGKVKAMSFTDNGSSTEFILETGRTWDVIGEGFQTEATADNPWTIMDALLEGTGFDPKFVSTRVNADGTAVEIAKEDAMDAGTYENLKLNLTVRIREGESYGLELPIPRLIVR